MKYLIVSDIHGSNKGIDLLKTAIEREKPACVLILGDILHGSGFENEPYCLSTFKDIKCPILFVRGNCDSTSDAKSLGFPLPEFRGFDYDGHYVHMSHILPQASFPPGDIVLSGHTHRKCIYKSFGVLYLNPGSISFPRDGEPGYATLSDNLVKLFNAENGQCLEEISF